MPVEIPFGSKPGFDHIAKTSPVVGSSATTAPRCEPSAVFAARWSAGSIVVTTVPPPFGLPRMMSVRFCAVNSGAVPARYGFIARSSPL